MKFSPTLATIVMTTSLTLTVSCAYDASDLTAAPSADSALSENVASTAQDLVFAPSYLELLNLANCYASGIDAIGVSDVDQGQAILSTCLAADVAVTIDFPGVGNFSFAQLDDFIGFVDQFFSDSGYVRTQHHASNIVRGAFGRTMRSYISATHVLPDGRVDLNTVAYDDEIDWVDGRWKIVRRDIFISSGVQLDP